MVNYDYTTNAVFPKKLEFFSLVSKGGPKPARISLRGANKSAGGPNPNIFKYWNDRPCKCRWHKASFMGGGGGGAVLEHAPPKKF